MLHELLSFRDGCRPDRVERAAGYWWEALVLKTLLSRLAGKISGSAPYSPRFELNRLSRSRRAANIGAIRGMRATAYLGDHVALCSVLGRFKIFVDTRDLSLTPHLMLEGYWEMWVTEVMADLVKPGMTFVDAGANFGYFSLLCAELVGPTGKVAAFEPNPTVAELMGRSVTVNGYGDIVEIHCKLLEDRDDAYMRFNIHTEFAGGSSMAPPVMGDDLETLYRTRRMDSFPHLLDADVIKIDVEGAEHSVWKGMTAIFERGRPLTIFLEFVPDRYPDPCAFLDEVLEWNFTLSEVSPDRGVVPISRDKILALPPKAELMLLLRR